MDRRDALKIFSLSAMLAISPIETLGSLERDQFSSSPFGIKLITPDSWQCLLLPDYLRLHKSDYNHNNPEVPIFACTRFREPLAFENDSVLLFADKIQLPSADPQVGQFSLTEAKVSSLSYALVAPTTDGRKLSFERDQLKFNDGKSNFHLQFEWQAGNKNRSLEIFEQVFNSVTCSHQINKGWG